MDAVIENDVGQKTVMENLLFSDIVVTEIITVKFNFYMSSGYQDKLEAHNVIHFTCEITVPSNILIGTYIGIYIDLEISLLQLCYKEVT